MTEKELRILDEMLTNLEIWSTWNKTFANEMIGICSKMRNLLADRKTESNSEKPNNCELQTIRCPKCGRTDYIRDMEKDMGIKGSHYKYKCINCNIYIKTEPTISKMEQVEDEPQTEDGIMPEVKAEVRFDENNKTLWIKTDTVENYDRVIIEDGSNWCRIFYEECGECAHNTPRSNDEPQTDCAWK